MAAIEKNRLFVWRASLPRSPTPIPVASPSHAHLATPAGLAAAVELNGAELRAALSQAGALLLRGWNVREEAEFQSAVLGLGLPPLKDYFPTEKGRRPLQGHTKFVWPTNSLRRTGAYLSGEVLPHSENYYAVRPPRYVCFWCSQAAWLGGDTCLVDGPAVFADLTPALQRLLSRRAFPVRRVVSLANLARHYSLRDPDALKAWCDRYAASGVRVQPHPDSPHEHLLVEFQKPSIWRSRCSDGRIRTSLAINFGECGVAARDALLSGLLGRGLFSGPQWALHRALWALAQLWPLFRSFLGHVDAVASLASDAVRGFAEWRRPPPAASDAGTLGAVLSLKQQQQVGRALAAHAYAFRWEAGDVLLLDNTVTLHDGLPGFGPRRLRVILLDEAVLPQSLDTLLGGVFEDPVRGPAGGR